MSDSILNLENHNNTMCGEKAGYKHEKGVYNVFIGWNAGADLVDCTGKVIIGDNIRILDYSQSDVLFIGTHVAIGKTIFGQPCNLQELIYNDMRKYIPNMKTYEEAML